MGSARGSRSGRKIATKIRWPFLFVSSFVLLSCATNNGQPNSGNGGTSAAGAFWGTIERDLAGLTGPKPPPTPPLSSAPVSDPAPQSKRWGAASVWQTNFTADACPRGTTGGACLSRAMAREHASPHAIAFARETGFNGYLTAFHAYGVVDIGTVTYPFFANDNEAPVLLNGTPPIVDVWKIAQKVDLRANPALRALLAHARGLALSDAPPKFLSEHTRPDGGQSFLFQIELSQCHACAPAARPVLAYDFDKEGRFLGAKVGRAERQP